MSRLFTCILDFCTQNTLQNDRVIFGQSMKVKRKGVKGSVSKHTTQPQDDKAASSSSSSLEISESLLISSSTSDEDATSRSTSRGDSLDSNRPLMRPPISYAMLITEAIQNSDDKRLILNDIYDYIVTHYPYFKTASSGWKVSTHLNNHEKYVTN